jgi:SAM-dependent methyltransferase
MSDGHTLQVSEQMGEKKAEGLRFWEEYWAEGAPTLVAVTMTQILDGIKFEYLKTILPEVGRTLEVGCGSGRLSCHLAKAGYRTIGRDFAFNALKAAHANYALAQVSGSFVAGDAYQIPFRDATFDIVLSTGLLEHFENPAPIVSEMVRVLRAGGIFYSDIVPRKFSLFRSLDWVGKVKRAVTDEKLTAFYARHFSSREIFDLLQHQGLVNVRVFPAGVVPPYLPLLYRSVKLRELEVSLVERTQRFWKWFDGTRLAEWLGFYYFEWGIKP